MIAMNHRLVNTVINRCVMPADGDILVPIRTVSVIGTTDIRAADPDEMPGHAGRGRRRCSTTASGSCPGFRQARALRVWAGVRPLFQDEKRRRRSTDTRDVSRTHAVVDHRARDGVDGLLTMSGGKLTTFRLMAAGPRRRDVRPARRASGRAARPRSVSRPATRTAQLYTLGSRLRRREATMQDEQLICECELIGRCAARGGRCAGAARRTSTTSGARCGSAWARARAASASTARRASCTRSTGSTARRRPTSLRDFLQERWKGMWPILYGDQLRQARLDDWIFQGLLDVEHLPTRTGPPHEPPRRRSSSAPGWRG